jgi:hypothetical protein
MAPLLVEAALTLVLLVAVAAGAAFCNASKTLTTPFPPHISDLLPIQGALQSVWFFDHSPPT